MVRPAVRNLLCVAVVVHVTAVLAVVGWKGGYFKSEETKEREAIEELARQQGITGYYYSNGWFRDKVELQPGFKEAAQEAGRLAAEETKGIEGLGAFFAHQQAMKRILKKKYGIDWRTVQEMNPGEGID